MDIDERRLSKLLMDLTCLEAAAYTMIDELNGFRRAVRAAMDMPQTVVPGWIEDLENGVEVE